LKYLATAKYLINNTTFPSYFNKRDGQIYINTWHGTPLKHMGKDINDGGFAHYKNILRNFLHCDYLVMPNKFTINVMLESHGLQSIFPGKLIDEGYPRNDLLFKKDSNFVRDTLGISSQKKTILYAPTWRGASENKEIDNTGKLKEDVLKIQEALGGTTEILLKVHYFEYKFLKNEEGLNVKLVPNWLDTNEVLSVVDILITDYSSIFFDFLPCNKPILFYVHDWENYKQNRGFYLELDSLPGPLCYNINELIENIKSINHIKDQYKERLVEFKEKYCYKDDGSATNRIVDAIFNNNHNSNVYSACDSRKKILIYPGGFKNNGITSSLINLLNNLDYTRYNISLVVNDKYDEISFNNLRKVNSNVNFIFRHGTFNFDLISHYRHLIATKLSKIKFFRKFYPQNLYKDEFRRVFGNTKFDVAIHFCGYSVLWTQLIAFNEIPKKVIYMHNDMLAESKKEKHKKGFEIIFPLYDYFDNIACVSDTTREINAQNLSKYIHDAKNKMVTVVNSLDHQKIQAKSKEYKYLSIDGQKFIETCNYIAGGQLVQKGILLPTDDMISFVTMGRLSQEKDHSKLLEAFYDVVNESNSKLRLYIIGEGPLEKKLKKLVKDLSLSNHVVFTGQLDNPFALINHCSCFILSSNYEGQPMVLLETLVLGKPIISTDIPGSRFVLQDNYGKLVDNSKDGLVHGMKLFIEGKIKQKKFDYKKYNTEALKVFYDELC
jgi:CDP-glycerol glycerophosphotransferase